ncbi:MAG: hypothetical protein ACJAZ9_001587 [Neolewinella sp.]
MRNFIHFPLLALLLLFSCGCETDLTTGTTVTDTDVIEEPGSTTVDDAKALEALNLVNDLRASGCTCGDEVFPPAPPLKLHATLQSVAEFHSADQANRQIMGHVGSDGRRVADRLSDAGFTWRGVAENVAWNQRSVEQVVNAWKGSTGHCKNIMNPGYEYMGFAVEDWYWTQVFAR